jgi:hypothetical protein
MARANQTFTPVTFGYLRREPKWLHLYCTALAKRRPAYTSLPLRKEADVIARRYDVSCGSAADLVRRTSALGHERTSKSRLAVPSSRVRPV